MTSQQHCYYLIEIPADYEPCPASTTMENNRRVQVYTKCGQTFTYLMDFSDLERICREKGWPVPCGGYECEFPERLEQKNLV